MMRLAVPPDSPPGQDLEKLPALAVLPGLTTAAYYLLPPRLQAVTAIQFLPQMTAYVAFILWISSNHGIIPRLGLERGRLKQGLQWGLGAGLVLGICNSWVILEVAPRLGHDIEFLAQTPHAQLPVVLMLPWTIVLIAIFVELNFRGFQLGRWLVLCGSARLPFMTYTGPVLAIGASSFLFAFDPFMVATFKHLHWIAMWDGIVWGTVWVRLRNLYAPMCAHAVEVIIMYSVVRHSLT